MSTTNMFALLAAALALIAAGLLVIPAWLAGAGGTTMTASIAAYTVRLSTDGPREGAIAGIASLVVVLATTMAERRGRPVNPVVGGAAVGVFGRVSHPDQGQAGPRERRTRAQGRGDHDRRLQRSHVALGRGPDPGPPVHDP